MLPLLSSKANRGRPPWLVIALFNVALLWSGSPTAAHPVSVSRVLVYVDADQLSTQVQVFLEDLYLFHQLKTDERNYLSRETIEKGIEAHQRFVAERFQILDADGFPMEPTSVQLEQWTPPEQGVPIDELMKHQLTFSIVFPPLASPPEFLTFLQRFSEEGAILPSEMTLQIQQAGEPAREPYSLRPHTPYTIRLRWDRPPPTGPEAEQRRREWLEAAKQETLGISDYSSIYCFAYVEPRELRIELLVPLQLMVDLVDLRPSDPQQLSVAEQPQVTQRVFDFFSKGVSIRYDDRPVAANLRSCRFFGLTSKDFAQSESTRPVSLASGRVGLIMSYQRPPSGAEFELRWDRFSEDWWSVDVVVISGERIEKKTLSRLGNRNHFRWRHATASSSENGASSATVPITAAERPRSLAVGRVTGWVVAFCLSLALPCLAFRRRIALPTAVIASIGWLLCWVAAWPAMASHVWPYDPLTADEAAALFAPLHRNIYESLDQASDEEVYDRLAASVAGEMLEDVYREIRLSLQMRDQGGAVSRVHEVSLRDSDLREQDEPSGLFRYRCSWEVAGSVEHWGHRHVRRQWHQADFSVRPLDGHWKIVDWQLLDEQLVDSQVSLRELN